jgi:hypothetical protein
MGLLDLLVEGRGNVSRTYSIDYLAFILLHGETIFCVLFCVNKAATFFIVGPSIFVVWL